MRSQVSGISPTQLEEKLKEQKEEVKEKDGERKYIVGTFVLVGRTGHTYQNGMKTNGIRKKTLGKIRSLEKESRKRRVDREKEKGHTILTPKAREY